MICLENHFPVLVDIFIIIVVFLGIGLWRRRQFKFAPETSAKLGVGVGVGEAVGDALLRPHHPLNRWARIFQNVADVLDIGGVGLHLRGDDKVHLILSLPICAVLLLLLEVLPLDL